MTKSQCFWSGSLITELFIPLGTIQPFIFISLTFCQSHIIRCAALLHGLGLRDHCASQRGQEALLYPALSLLTLSPTARSPINHNQGCLAPNPAILSRLPTPHFLLFQVSLPHVVLYLGSCPSMSSSGTLCRPLLEENHSENNDF